MKKTYAILNMVVLMAVIVWNYVCNAVGIKGNTVASLSAEYDNLFTPAGYAFSIWGLIYLGLLGHSIFQLTRAFSHTRDNAFIQQIGPWLIIANLANGAWLWCWLQEYTGASVVVMLVLLVALLTIVVRLNMERWHAPRAIITWVWWPICIYSGWITVATIANVAAYLAKLQWHALFSEVTWTVIMIVIATAINLIMIGRRNMHEFALVGTWALAAIAVRHWGTVPIVQWMALAAAAVLFVVSTMHGFRNRSAAPLM